jgi:hypothetical protein
MFSETSVGGQELRQPIGGQEHRRATARTANGDSVERARISTSIACAWINPIGYMEERRRLMGVEACPVDQARREVCHRLAEPPVIRLAEDVDAGVVLGKAEAPAHETGLFLQVIHLAQSAGCAFNEQ